MNASEFVEKWSKLPPDYGRRLIRLNNIEKSQSFSANVAFLSEAGLPEDTVACLQFYALESGLLSLYDAYGQPSDWSEQERERLTAYLVIGCDASGNPVCLDLNYQERIVLLDHEDCFALWQIINSSVAQLAQCLLIFEETVLTYQQQCGKKAELYDNRVPEELKTEAAKRMRAVDTEAMTAGAFWLEQLSVL